MANTYALQSAGYDPTYTAYKRGAFAQLVVTFVAGVPSVAAARSAAGFTVAGDTGLYTGTAPLAARGVIMSQCLCATADNIVTITSYNPVTGVFAFRVLTANTGVAVDVATGDEVWFLFLLEGG